MLFGTISLLVNEFRHKTEEEYYQELFGSNTYINNGAIEDEFPA